MTIVAVGQIEVDDRGVAYVGRSRMKVSQVVLARNVSGLSAEEIAEAYDTISLSDVFTALAYYAAHREQIDSQIAQEEARIAELRQETENRQLQDQLRRMAVDSRPTP